MCCHFDPLFWHSGDWTHSFEGTKTTNPAEFDLFGPKFHFSLIFLGQISSGICPSVFRPSTPHDLYCKYEWYDHIETHIPEPSPLDVTLLFVVNIRATLKVLVANWELFLDTREHLQMFISWWNFTTALYRSQQICCELYTYSVNLYTLKPPHDRWVSDIISKKSVLLKKNTKHFPCVMAQKTSAQSFVHFPVVFCSY